MDEQDEQRGKLASVGSDNTRQRQDIRQRVLEATRERPDRDRRSPAHIAVEWWERFWATSFWEKAVVLGGTALAGIAAIVASLALSGSSGDQSSTLAQEPAPQAALGAPARTATVPPTVASTATAMPTDTPVVADPTPDDVEVEPPPTAEPPNRRNCQAIAGTAYLSSVEREWFLDHCLDADTPGGPVVPPSQPAPPSDPSGPPPPPPTPVPAPTSSTQVSASEAITLAVGWMVSQTGNTYSISQESCYATHMGARWVVVCQAELVGCQGDVCSTTLSACVFEQPLFVAPADSC